MSELDYQAPTASSGKVAVAWIVTLVLGSLYCLAGTCAGVGAGIAVIEASGFGNNDALLGLISIACILYLLGVGITCIWASLRLRLGSRRAAKIAMGVCAVNAALIVGIYLFGPVTVASSGPVPDPFSFVFGTVFYLGAAVTNAIPAWLLKRALVDLPIHRDSLIQLIPRGSAGV